MPANHRKIKTKKLLFSMLRQFCQAVIICLSSGRFSTIFCKEMSGQTAETGAAVETTRKSRYSDVPAEPVAIKSAEVICGQ